MTAPVLLPRVRVRPPTPPALLAVAHGSRDPRAAAALEALVARVRALDGAPPEVRLAYVDHSDPSVGRALTELDDQPAVVVPLLLAAAAHSKGDIPGALQAAGTGAAYARPLGPHPLVLDTLAQRLREAGVADSDAVVLAATGSADPEANADLAKVARLLWERRRGGPVEIAFASATRPDVVETIARLRRLGSGRIAVAAYFLAPGRLLDRVHDEAAGLPVTAPLADSTTVAQLVLERYAEAAAGPVAMNCDCCVYRTAWPGHEHRVGSPQRPHPHPGDAS